MRTWLLKSEPAVWSWSQQCAVDIEPWTGVRNPQAHASLRAMSVGDRGFFYHSNEGREIVGIVEIAAPYAPDPTDPSCRFGMVGVRALSALPRPVSLRAIKADSRFADLALVRQPRLSVLPVNPDHWALLCSMGGLDPENLKTIRGSSCVS
ncbi:MAG TPA: EVE domain-containing protein [Alphaproteobacteria bacterium]|nr:EVE domain-containing protein [Alphaproteobacteria bacterium]